MNREEGVVQDELQCSRRCSVLVALGMLILFASFAGPFLRPDFFAFLPYLTLVAVGIIALGIWLNLRQRVPKGVVRDLYAKIKDHPPQIIEFSIFCAVVIGSSLFGFVPLVTRFFGGEVTVVMAGLTTEQAVAVAIVTVVWFFFLMRHLFRYMKAMNFYTLSGRSWRDD